MHKSQVLFFILAAFVLGTFVGSFWNIFSVGILIGILLGTIVLTLSGYRGTFGHDKIGIYRRKLGFLFGFLILIFVLGVFRFNQFNSGHSLAAEFSDHIIGGKAVSYVFRGYVASDPENKAGQTKFIFRVKSIIVPGKQIITDENILVTTNLIDNKFGDKLSITGALITPKNFSEDFDYISYLKKDSIKFLINFPKDIKNNPESVNLGTWDNFKIYVYKNIFILKNRFETAINRSIVEPNASFVNGILLGTRQNISQELKDAFGKTGTSHVLAISGYNITIIAWGIMAGLFYFVKRKKAFWISVVTIIIFTIMTGASASVVRAAIMGLILLFASGYGRLYDSRNALLLAGALMIYQNPLVLRFDIGFQLSFLAVLGLIYLMPILNYLTRRFPEGRLKETVTATLAAQIFVLPLLIYYFKNFSWVSLPANILILPFMPLVMLLGFLTGIIGMFLQPLGQLIGYLTWALTEYQLGAIRMLSKLEPATVSMSLWVLLVVYVLLFGATKYLHSRYLTKES